MMRRALITGIGVLSPLGNGAQAFFKSALSGKCGIRQVTKFDTSALPVHIGGEINMDCEQILSEEVRAEAPRVAQWAVLAARKAVQDASLNVSAADPYAIDIVMGMSISSLECLGGRTFSSVRQFKPADLVLMNPAAAAVQISRDIGTFGEAVNVSSACSSSTSAIGYALRLIQSGDSDCVLAGGADEGVSPLFLGAYGKALSQRSDDPSRACRPFERSRDGAVFADAACILVIEEYERARLRGVQAYCEITGYGATNEAGSAFCLNQSEEPSSKCALRAIQNAGIDAATVDYYCALGIAHPFLDIRETRMVRRVFKEHADRLAVSSIKSMIGHPLGASGAIQTATAAMAIKTGAVPPTMNYEEPDPECDLDYVPNEARQMRIRNSLVYTLGTGGANAALVLSAC